MGHMQEWTINTDYPWNSATCTESRSKYSIIYILYVLNQRGMIIIIAVLILERNVGRAGTMGGT